MITSMASGRLARRVGTDHDSRPMPTRILIHQDDPQMRAEWMAALQRVGHHVEPVVSAAALVQFVGTSAADLVILDVAQPPGLAALAGLRNRHPGLPILGTTRHATTESLAEALASGASDVIHLPCDRVRLLASVDGLLAGGDEAVVVRPGQRAGTAMAGSSPSMQEVFRRLALAATNDQPVLIAGPPGAGKSLAAWMLHRHSRRHASPFRCFDFRPIPDQACDSVIADGSLGTDCAGGTLVLDGALGLGDAQLGRILSWPDLRLVLIADTDRDATLAPAWIERSGIRHIIVLPPLRTRPEDLGPTTANLLQQHADRLRHDVSLSPRALAALRSHDWPGNVRELRDRLATAVARTDDGAIRPEHLVLRDWQDPEAQDADLRQAASQILERENGRAYAAWRDRLDVVLLDCAMHRTQRNQVAASALLGIHRATLRKRCRELGIATGTAP